MRKTLHRLVAMLLVLTLFASMLPTAFAAETETTAPTESTMESTVETTVPETVPETESPTEESTEATEEPEPPMMEEYSISTASEDYGIMTAAATTGNILLFDYTGYTITLNSQLGITYRPNGSGSSTTAYLKNIGWHYARYNNIAYHDDPIYCLEPNVSFGASTSYNSMDTGVTVSGSGYTSGASVWYAMPQSYRRAITLILLYSDQMWNDSYSVASTYRDSNPNTPLHLATQFLIYEIVMGIRDANTFYAWGNGYVDGDILYNAGCQVSNFAPNYNSLVAYVQSAMALPSFVGSSTSNAPTIDLEESLTWLHDDNGVLSNFSFPGDDTVNFNIYGNDMCVEPLGTISSSKVYSCYRSIPSPDSSTVALYYDSASSYQTCVKLYSPSSSYLYGYFKLNQPVTTGNMNIIKTTSDGQNLSGWKFSLYFDSACTRLFAGPYTTSSAGRISFTGTTPGTYYVREEGHTNSAINAKYTCTSANPQKIVVTAGQTSSVTFTNTLKPGTLNLVKSTSDGQNLAGWQFNIYSNSSCTSLISGPHTTDSSGKLSVSLSAGTVYVKELGHTNSTIAGMYTCSSTNPQSVTISAGGTASVTFVNTVQTGSLKITKVTSDDRNKGGWQFNIYSDSSCSNLISGPHSTASGGTVTVSGLPLGKVFVKEVGNEDADVAAEYVCTSTNPQGVTISAGTTANVSFTNELKPGSLIITKKTSDNKNLAGWQFGLYEDAACTKLAYGPYTTDSSGKITIQDLPSWSQFYVTEIGNTDPEIEVMYELTGSKVWLVQILAGETKSLTFNNTLQPGEVIIKKVTSDGENLAGWQFSVYRDADCNQKISGPHTTDSSGIISAGSYGWDVVYIREEGHEDPNIDAQYTCTGINPVTVVISHGGTSTVTFQNTLSLGRIEIQKTTNTGNHLDGWVFRITDSDGNEVAELVTDKNGYAISEELPAGRYLIQELYTDDDYWQISLGGHDVVVKAGETTVDEWHNVEQGLARFYKKTNTGDSVEGWEITIYADADCTQEIRTLTTNEDGYTGYYMSPGTYWAKETSDTEGRFDSEYWLVDERVQKFEVKPHEDVSIEFSNVHYGKLKVVKTVDGEGPLEGWQFKVTDSDGKEIDGSPFTTQEDGTILIGSLLPGELTVEEILPEDSPYTCVSENPQKVTIQAGSVTEVSFTNTLKPGKITIHKVDNVNEPLAGAKFLLEWSEDGVIWWPIEYSAEKTAEEGGCDNPNVEDGCLTSGADGLLEWGNLYPTLYYRVTELEAPEGYELLKDYAYEGLLPEETLELSFRVINCPGFTLPDTGATSGAVLRIGQLLCLIGAVSLLLVAHNKKKKG